MALETAVAIVGAGPAGLAAAYMAARAGCTVTLVVAVLFVDAESAVVALTLATSVRVVVLASFGPLFLTEIV